MPKFARPNSYNGKQSNQNWTGQVRAANPTEAAAGVSEQLYISPATLTARLAAPGAIGASTPGAGTFTTITSNGNIIKNVAGNKDVYTSVATNATAGANSAGSVTLVGGTATVTTTAVTANSLIRWSRQGIGATGAAALGHVSIGTITPGTSFVINAVQAANATALQASDVSVIFWEIIN